MTTCKHCGMGIELREAYVSGISASVHIPSDTFRDMYANATRSCWVEEWEQHTVEYRTDHSITVFHKGHLLPTAQF